MIVTPTLEYKTNKSLSLILVIDYKTSLMDSVRAMGYHPVSSHRKERLACWLAEHILNHQSEVWERLTPESKHQLQQLLKVEKGHPICVPYCMEGLQLQKMNMVVTYEDTKGKQDFLFLLDEVREAYLPYANRIIEEDNHEFTEEDFKGVILIDCVEKYPVKSQVLIWFLINNISMGLPSPLPLNDFLPFDDDFHNLLEQVCTSAPEQTWKPLVKLLANDARMVLSTIPDMMKEMQNKNYDFDTMPMGFFLNSIGLMMLASALQHTLKTVSTMSEKEVNRLLNDRSQEGGIVYFNALEKLADKIILQVMKDIDPSNVVKRR